MKDAIEIFYGDLGEIIQAKRKEKGLTQEAVAKELGLNRVTLANLEAGEHRLLAHHLLELCAVLDLNLSDILKNYNAAKMKGAMINAPDVLKEAVNKANTIK